MRDNCADPTPYAVICRNDGRQFISAASYLDQMMRPNARWKCPVCGGRAEWDDDCQATDPLDAETQP